MIVQQRLGALPPTSSLIATGVTTGGVISAATGATASLLAAIGISAQAVPIVGTIIGGVALAITALGIGNGCGNTCTEATTIANNASAALAANLQAAQAQAAANGGCLTSAEQAVALANIQTILQQLVAGCSQIPAPGGTQCVADRIAGGKYDIYAENAPTVLNIPVCSTVSATPTSVTSSSNVSSGVDTLASNIGISSEMLWIGGIGIVGLVLLFGRRN